MDERGLPVNGAHLAGAVSVRWVTFWLFALCSSIGAGSAAAAPPVSDPAWAALAEPRDDAVPVAEAPPERREGKGKRLVGDTDEASMAGDDRSERWSESELGDALFVAIGTGLGGVAGFAAVVLTATTVIYSTVNIVSIVGPYAFSQYWGWSLLGIIPVVVSLLAIPIGGAFGMWWGAGLRGLPFPLVDALAHMGVGLLLGAAAGGMVMAPVGMLVGAMAMGGLVPFGRPPNPLEYQSPRLASLGALVVVPLFAGVLPAAAVGMTVGGTIGPVLTAARWGLFAKSAYGTIEDGPPAVHDAE